MSSTILGDGYHSMFSVCGFVILTAANCVAVVIGDQVINPNDSDNEQAARVMATGSPVVWALMCILSLPFKGACGKFPAYLMLIGSAAASARLGSVLGSKAFGMDDVGSKYVAPAAVGFAIIAAVVVFSLDCCGTLGRGNTNLAGGRDGSRSDALIAKDYNDAQVGSRVGRTGNRCAATFERLFGYSGEAEGERDALIDREDGRSNHMGAAD